MDHHQFFYADKSSRFIEFEIDKDSKMTQAWFIGNGDKRKNEKIMSKKNKNLPTAYTGIER